MNKAERNLSKDVPAVPRQLSWPIPGEKAVESNENLERKIRERTADLLASEEKYRLLLENANEAILVLQGGAIRFANPMATRIWGYSFKELKAIPFGELLSGPDLGRWKEYTERIAMEPTDITASFRSRTKDGRPRWLEVKGTHSTWEGRPATLTLITDITERKEADDELKQSYARLRRAMDGAVKALALMAERRDPYTAGHQQRVAQLAVGIAQELGLAPQSIETIAVAGLLHDVGKVSVPTEILSKPSKLNENEFNLLRGHSQVSYDIVKTLALPWDIDQIVLQHHERLDGSGYPQGLRAENINLGAKILGVADVVEAMVSHRPYRAALGLDKALAEISGKKGALYDAAVVEACLRLFQEKGFKLEDYIRNSPPE